MVGVGVDEGEAKTAGWGAMIIVAALFDRYAELMLLLLVVQMLWLDGCASDLVLVRRDQNLTGGCP